MNIFFVDCYRNCLKVFELDITKGKYNRAWSITYDGNTKDSVLSLIGLVVHSQPNQVIIDTTGHGVGVKEHFHDILSKVDFVRLNEQGNLKYVQYMSPDDMEMLIRRMVNNEQKD